MLLRLPCLLLKIGFVLVVTPTITSPEGVAVELVGIVTVKEELVVIEAPDVFAESVTELVLDVELVVAEEAVDDPLLPALSDVENEGVPETGSDVDVDEPVSGVLLDVALEVEDPAFELVAEVNDVPVVGEDPGALEETLEVVDELLGGGPVLEDELVLNPVPELVPLEEPPGILEVVVA